MNLKNKAKRVINFGVIGAGWMGREFAIAAASWAALVDVDFVPRIVAVCDINEAATAWFASNIDSVTFTTTDYKALLERDDVEAVYCAIPHNLHADVYVDILNAGKHLMGEKPFGIDLAANQRIAEAISAHPNLMVACSSEFPFHTGAQRVLDFIREKRFGTIMEVWSSFLHSSDLNPQKKINWKRMIEMNGEYGAMGDLGMHTMHLPLRVGWTPVDVRAMLSNIITERPNADGEMVPCKTWDNATLACTVDGEDGSFPLYVKNYRIAPGEMNTWSIRVLGTDFCAAFSTKRPRTLRLLDYPRPGAEQAWQDIDIGYDMPYKTIRAGIIEVGFTDLLLQMWAAFCDELVNGRDGMKQPFYCATPEESHMQHKVFTAALASHKNRSVETV